MFFVSRLSSLFDELDKFGRRHGLADRREAAHVHEHDGQLALFPAEAQGRGSFSSRARTDGRRIGRRPAARSRLSRSVTR